MTPSPNSSDREREAVIDLADKILRAWEASEVCFDGNHQIQAALIAARFLLAHPQTEDKPHVD